MTIDAEQSCGKITVIKGELQAEQSLLWLKGHLHKYSNIQISPYRKTNSDNSLMSISNIMAYLYSEEC